MTRKHVFLLAPLLLAGCVVGPSYHRPEVALPDGWATPPSAAAVIGPATEQWWKSFEDPELNSLVTRAVEANLDLKLAAAHVEEARASRGVARSGGLPQLTGTATASRQRQITQGFVSNESGTGGSLQTFPYETNLFSGLVDMSWEIDLFGGIRRQVQAAQADLAAQQEDRCNVFNQPAGRRGNQLRAGPRIPAAPGHCPSQHRDPGGHVEA